MYPKRKLKTNIMKKLILSIVLLITTSVINAQNQNPFEVKVVGKGEPVILIPGYSCPGEVWNETVEHFKSNYQFHIFSIAGFGGTKPIQNDEILKTVRDAIITYTKDNKLKKPMIVGHSLGAFMTLWLHSTQPDLFGKSICVDGLPFVSAVNNPTAKAEELKKSPQYDKQAVINNFKNLPNEGYVKNMIVAMKNQVTDTVQARKIAEWSYKSDRATLGSTIVEMATTDLRNEISKIKQPILVLTSLWGTKEASEKEYNLQYAELKNKTIKVANAKHFIMYDAPDWFYNEIGLFLKSK
jgi:pimeloyl-ACP methyl ester carboxylesterase